MGHKMKNCCVSFWSLRGHFALAQRYRKQFFANEDGTIAFFGLFIFLLILMVGGIGVDLMHFEQKRTKLQVSVVI